MRVGFHIKRHSFFIGSWRELTLVVCICLCETAQLCVRQFEVRHIESNERLPTNNDYLLDFSLAYYAPVICVWLTNPFLLVAYP